MDVPPDVCLGGSPQNFLRVSPEVPMQASSRVVPEVPLGVPPEVPLGIPPKFPPRIPFLPESLLKVFLAVSQDFFWKCLSKLFDKLL